MAKKNSRYAFTLIEVMVAVMIISVVIMALMKLYGDNTHIFSTLKQKTKITSYASFFLSNYDYGWEKESVDLDDLLKGFDVDDDLRRELKSKKAQIIYQELERIDMSKFDEGEIDNVASDEQQQTEEVNSNMVFEIGKTILKVDGSSVALLRLRLQ